MYTYTGYLILTFLQINIYLILRKKQQRTGGAMRKLALSDEILLSIEKPARYIGGEVNSVMKDKDEVDIRFAMCFPDVYEIGMSHLGIQILYDMFNRREDTWCERVYSPWLDLDKVLREKNIPLFALESQARKEYPALCAGIPGSGPGL